MREPARFVARLATLLRPGGILIGSVPTTPSVDANPHHLHDFTERAFRRLFLPHALTEVDCLRQTQYFQPLALLTRREPRTRNLRRSLPLYYLTHPASLFHRLAATMRYGFANKYLTLAWQRPENS